MFLTENFIQDKYITGQQGQRFVFSDKMVIDLVNLEQKVSPFKSLTFARYPCNWSKTLI